MRHATSKIKKINILQAFVSRKFEMFSTLFAESFNFTWLSDRHGAQLKMKAFH